MKKYEIPEITITMFDAVVVTDTSAVGNTENAMMSNGGINDANNIKVVNWTVTG